MPILLRCLPIFRPGVPAGTRNALIPLVPCDLSVIANTIITPATGAFDRNLAAVEDPVISVQHRDGRAGGGVGARSRLGQRERPEHFTLAKGHEPSLLLFFRPELEQWKDAREVWHSSVKPVVAQARDSSSAR